MSTSVFTFSISSSLVYFTGLSIDNESYCGFDSGLFSMKFISEDAYSNYSSILPSWSFISAGLPC